MSNHPTPPGLRLRPDHGDRRFIFLKNDDTMELIYDLNAVMRHQALFELPMAPVLEKLQLEVASSLPDATPEQMSTAMAALLIDRHLAKSYIEELAGWAYCLTESWREDHPEQNYSWSQFRRLLQEPPPTGSASRKAQAKMKAAMAWMMAVAEVRAREEVDEDEDPAGNFVAEGPAPASSPSADANPSTGTPSSMSPPVGGAEPRNEGPAAGGG